MFKTISSKEITYNGKEYVNDIKKISNIDISINTIDELFELLLEVWCKETAYPGCQEEYDRYNNPALGQCAITSLIVNDIFGGTINKVKIGDIIHYFNIINGHYIDLTSSQFNSKVDYSINEERTRERCLDNEDTLNRYNILKDLLYKHKVGR